MIKYSFKGLSSEEENRLQSIQNLNTIFDILKNEGKISNQTHTEMNYLLKSASMDWQEVFLNKVSESDKKVLIMNLEKGGRKSVLTCTLT